MLLWLWSGLHQVQIAGIPLGMCNTSSNLWSKTSVGKYCPGPQQGKLLIYLSAPRRDQWKSKIFVKGKGRGKCSIESLLVPGTFQIHNFKTETLITINTYKYLFALNQSEEGRQAADWKPRRSCSASSHTQLRMGRDLANNSLIFASGTPGTGSCWPREAAAPQGMFCFQW